MNGSVGEPPHRKSTKRAFILIVLAFGVLVLGWLAAGVALDLSGPPPANGSWFGIGLTGWQVTFYEWVGVSLFAVGLGCLLLLGYRYFGDSAPPLLSAGEPAPTSQPGGRQPLRSKLTAAIGVRATFVAVGALLLVTFVFTGAVAQVGFQECCSGYNCGPQPGICPWSLTGLWLTVALQAGCAGIIAEGLAGFRHLRQEGIARGPGAKSPAPDGWSLAGFLLASLGPGLLALGLLLPWDRFGFCVDGPCGYPYALTGYPLELVEAGTAALVLGIGLLAYVGIRNWSARAAREGPTKPEVLPSP